MDWHTTTGILHGLETFDDHAWADLVACFRRPILNVAERKGFSEAECEDIAQETLLAFADAYRKGRYDREKGKLRHWLFAMARRKIHDALRRKYRTEAHREPMDKTGQLEQVAGEDDLEREWDEAWRQSVLHECLARVKKEVTDNTWRAFEKVALQGEDPKKVAEELGLSRSAVFVAKHRVVKKLKELEDQFED